MLYQHHRSSCSPKFPYMLAINTHESNMDRDKVVHPFEFSPWYSPLPRWVPRKCRKCRVSCSALAASGGCAIEYGCRWIWVIGPGRSICPCLSCTHKTLLCNFAIIACCIVVCLIAALCGLDARAKQGYETFDRVWSWQEAIYAASSVVRQIRMLRFEWRETLKDYLYTYIRRFCQCFLLHKSQVSTDNRSRSSGRLS